MNAFVFENFVLALDGRSEIYAKTWKKINSSILQLFHQEKWDVHRLWVFW